MTEPTPIRGVWAGRDVYRCRLCPFDTLEEAKFIHHFATMHPPLEIIDGGKANEPAPEISERTSREDLEARALELGIEDPSRDTYPNKAALIEAIVAADESEDTDA
jgi:hypothetical protein